MVVEEEEHRNQVLLVLGEVKPAKKAFLHIVQEVTVLGVGWPFSLKLNQEIFAQIKDGII